jgi:5-methylcytosine-specific restriction enzyme A
MANPFTHERRRSMTQQRRARIFAAHDEQCHRCTRKIRPGDDWDVDHVLALERGGTDDDENLAPICEWCHTEKTADDHATAGHMRRGYTKHNVPGRFRKSKGWRT